MAGKLDVKPMGAYTAEIEAKQAERRAHEAALKQQVIDDLCSECGGLGGFNDGKYSYCRDHLPDEFYEGRDNAKRFQCENPDEYKRIHQSHVRRLERIGGGS
jgi:hypothetical protein